MKPTASRMLAFFSQLSGGPTHCAIILVLVNFPKYAFAAILLAFELLMNADVRNKVQSMRAINARHLMCTRSRLIMTNKLGCVDIP